MLLLPSQQPQQSGTTPGSLFLRQSHRVAQAALQLSGSSDPSASASAAGITRLHVFCKENIPDLVTRLLSTVKVVYLPQV